MKVKQSHRVRLLQKVTILVFLTFLAYGDRNTMVAGMNKKFAAVVLEKPLQKQQRLMPQQQQQQQQQQKQQENHHVNHHHHNHHSMDLFTSSKRRVPNASDPLHNR